MIPIVLGLAVVGFLLSRAAKEDPTPQQSSEEIAAEAKARADAERKAMEQQTANDINTAIKVGGGIVGAVVPLIPIVKGAIDAGVAANAAAVTAKVAADAAVAAKGGVEIVKVSADIAKTSASGFANLGFAIYGGVLAVYVIAMTILSAVCERRSEWVAAMKETAEQYWPTHQMENVIAQDWLRQNGIPFSVESFKDDRLSIPLVTRGYQTIGSRNKIVPVFGHSGGKDRDGNVFDARAWLQVQLMARAAALSYTKTRLEIGAAVYKFFYSGTPWDPKFAPDELAKFPLCGGETLAPADPEKIYIDLEAPELTSARQREARAPKGDAKLNRFMSLKGRFAALGTLRKNPTLYRTEDLQGIRKDLWNIIFGDLGAASIDWNFDLMKFPQESFDLPAVAHPLATVGLIPGDPMPPNRLGNWDGYISLAEVMAGRGGVTGALSGAGLG